MQKKKKKKSQRTLEKQSKETEPWHNSLWRKLISRNSKCIAQVVVHCMLSFYIFVFVKSLRKDSVIITHFCLSSSYKAFSFNKSIQWRVLRFLRTYIKNWTYEENKFLFMSVFRGKQQQSIIHIPMKGISMEIRKITFYQPHYGFPKDIKHI